MCPHNLNWWVATKLMYILNIPGVHKRLEGPQTSTANSWMARDYDIRPWPFTHNIQLAHDEIRCHALWQRTRQRLCQQLTAVYECRKTWFPVWQPILRITKWVQSAWRTPSGTHVTWLDTTWSPDKELTAPFGVRMTSAHTSHLNTVAQVCESCLAFSCLHSLPSCSCLDLSPASQDYDDCRTALHFFFIRGGKDTLRFCFLHCLLEGTCMWASLDLQGLMLDLISDRMKGQDRPSYMELLRIMGPWPLGKKFECNVWGNRGMTNASSEIGSGEMGSKPAKIEVGHRTKP